MSLTGHTLGGADAAKYTLDFTGAPTTTASITAKTLTVGGTFTAHDKAFDNTTAATINTNSLTLVGKVGADVVTLTPTLVFSDAAVGAGKTVSVTGAASAVLPLATTRSRWPAPQPPRRPLRRRP